MEAGKAVKNGELLPLLATGTQGGITRPDEDCGPQQKDTGSPWCLAGGKGDKDPALTLLLPSHHLLGSHPHGSSSRMGLEGQLRRSTLPASLDLFLPSACTRGERWERGIRALGNRFY